MVEVTKTQDDDLPREAKGAMFLCFAPADDEDEAVREAVKLFRQAGMSPLEVTNLGTVSERESQGYEISEDELKLAQDAVVSNAVVIFGKELIYEGDQPGWVN